MTKAHEHSGRRALLHHTWMIGQTVRAAPIWYAQRYQCYKNTPSTGQAKQIAQYTSQRSDSVTRMYHCAHDMIEGGSPYPEYMILICISCV